MSSLREQVKNLEIRASKRRKDFDPEDDDPFARPADDSEQSDSEASENEDLGRDHYEEVGKSKLRKPEKSKLDEKKYGAQAVSRDNLFQDHDTDALALDQDEDRDEDPFAVKDVEASDSQDESMNGEDNLSNDEDVDEDEEIESDEAFEDGEEDQFRKKGFIFRGSGQGLTSLPTGSDEESGSEISQATDESPEDDSDAEFDEMDGLELEAEVFGESVSEDDEDEDEDEDEEAAHPRPSTLRTTAHSDREKLKSLIANDTAALASSLSASQSADAKKGAAVKQQYQTFDRLLDARIKLQKGLTASNDLSPQITISDEEARAALQKAEDAALRLYSTIESLRHSIHNHTDSSAATSRKRKQPTPTPATSMTPTPDLWSRLSTLESDSLPLRRSTLDKWATKTRAVGPQTSSSSSSAKLHGHPSRPTPLTSVLDTYLLSPSTNALDDTPFYQTLLRDLIASRARTAQSSSAMTPTPALPTQLHTRRPRPRTVDVKASKGRKVRYTVHEKLANFTAGEGRGGVFVGQWNDAAVAEFFASLLGQRNLLSERDGEDMDGDGDRDGDGDGEGEALRLFRT